MDTIENFGTYCCGDEWNKPSVPLVFVPMITKIAMVGNFVFVMAEAISNFINNI